MLSNLNFWAALFGLVGSILIFLYGIPRMIDDDGTVLLSVGKEKEEAKKGKRFKHLGNLGLLLLIFSFIFQIVDIFIKSYK